MKREEQALNTKKRIVVASTKLFLEKGYDHTTIQDIMDATNLSKGALYHHFKSKQQILECQTNYEQEAITNYLKMMVENRKLTAKQKIENIIDHLSTNEALFQLTRDRWAEKVPFALLNTLRNTLNVLADYITEILYQGNSNKEFNCIYPKEIASTLMLLMDVWLDPIIVDCNYEEVCSKVDFIILFLKKFDAPVVSDEKGEEIKRRLRCHYV
jgi:AcrR family transcriptional regulator